MSKNIFVGNLPYSTTEDDLTALFESTGAVESVRIIVDRETQRKRGFGFVLMKNEDAALEAIARLSGHRFRDRELIVAVARPHQARTAPRDA